MPDSSRPNGVFSAEFASKTADIFVPDGATLETALSRTTHLGIGAHQDDLEIMAYHGILECYRAGKKGFLGIVVSDGAGSPRAGSYAAVTDGEMMAIRNREQKNAAILGGYSASIILGHPTSRLKDPADPGASSDIRLILKASKPSVVYTHNLADRHDTHVAVALRAIKAMRDLPAEMRPKTVYGCEVWRGLDWLGDRGKKALDVTGNDTLASSLILAHDSQVAGGKRYDLATLGRRRANATYDSAHSTDKAGMLIYAMDLTPLVSDPGLDIPDFIASHTDEFSRDVAGRLARLA